MRLKFLSRWWCRVVLPSYAFRASKAKGIIALKVFILCVSGTPASAQEEESSTIVLFGDSTTVGFNVNFGDRFGNGTTERGCPTIYLNNILLNLEPRTDPEDCPTTIYPSPILDANDQVRNVVVANWGVGGSNTADGVGRISSNLNQTKLDHPASNYYVLIVYGTNDFGSEISASMTHFNTRIMIQQARSAGYIPVMGTITPRDDRDISPYNAEIVSAAQEENAPVIDMFARFIAQPGGWRTIVQQEVSVLTGELVRFHPTDEGYLIIAETWFDQYLQNVIQAERPDVNVAPILDLLLND